MAYSEGRNTLLSLLSQRSVFSFIFFSNLLLPRNLSCLIYAVTLSIEKKKQGHPKIYLKGCMHSNL